MKRSPPPHLFLGRKVDALTFACAVRNSGRSAPLLRYVRGSRSDSEYAEDHRSGHADWRLRDLEQWDGRDMSVLLPGPHREGFWKVICLPHHRSLAEGIER